MSKFYVSQYRKVKLIEKRGHKCELCGYSKYPEILVVHHKKFKKYGGRNEDHNLIILCPNCHSLIHIKEKIKNFAEHSKEVKTRSRKWAERNQEYVRKYMDIWYKNNKEKVKKLHKKWNIHNKDKMKKYWKEYYLKNKNNWNKK